MPVPTLLTDLSTTIASNSPAGSDNVFPSLDDYLRSLSGFLASIRDNSGNGWVSPYLPLAGGTVTGPATFSSTLALNGALSGTGLTTYLASPPAIGGTAAAAVSSTNLSYTGTLTGGTGVVNLGSGQFYKDASGNVGIGTATPGAKLDVVGTAAISGAVTLSGGTANGIGYLNGSKVLTTGSALTFDGNLGTTGNIYLKTAGTKLGWDVSGVYFNWIESGGTSGADYLRFAIANAEQMRLTSTGLGIGTSSPNRKLEVNGISRFTDGTSNVEITNGGGVGYIGPQSNHPLAFQTNNTERMRLDASGNLGLGVTPSAWLSSARAIDASGYASFATWNNASGVINNGFYNASSQWIYKNTAAAAQYYQVNGQHVWLNAPSGTAGNAITFTQAMTLDASGNLGVGGATPYAKVAAYVASSGTFQNAIGATNSANSDLTVRIKTSITDFYNSAGDFTFSTGGSGGTERARITSGGYSKFSNDGTYLNGSGTNHEMRQSAADIIAYFTNKNATSPFGVEIDYTALDPNNTGNAFFAAYGTTTLRAQIRSNGGIANFSANNVALSDERLKTDIQPATSYLDKICAIPVKTFLYKDQTDTERNLGVIAQDVEAVAPELIDHSGFGEAPEGESPYLAVYQTDLQYALMKCIQEQQDLITSLTARVASLETQP